MNFTSKIYFQISKTAEKKLYFCTLFNDCVKKLFSIEFWPALQQTLGLFSTDNIFLMFVVARQFDFFIVFYKQTFLITYFQISIHCSTQFFLSYSSVIYESIDEYSCYSSIWTLSRSWMPSSGKLSTIMDNHSDRAL